MKEKPIIVILAIFFTAAMVTFTFVSRYTVEHRLPYVKTIFPEAQLVVPEKAVHINEKGSPCVFIVVQENTFLGEQPVADRIPVTIVSYKEEGVELDGIDINDEIIVEAERELEAGERIRRENG